MINVFKKIKPYFIGFGIGVIFCLIAIWAIYKDSGSKVTADLRAAKWSLESATRTNAELAQGIQRLQSDLSKSNTIITEQQSVIIRQQSAISNQQSIIDKQKSVIDGILTQINGTGNGIRAKIQAIADGFRLLYQIYNESPK